MFMCIYIYIDKYHQLPKMNINVWPSYYCAGPAQGARPRPWWWPGAKSRGKWHENMRTPPGNSWKNMGKCRETWNLLQKNRTWLWKLALFKVNPWYQLLKSAMIWLVLLGRLNVWPIPKRPGWSRFQAKDSLSFSQKTWVSSIPRDHIKIKTHRISEIDHVRCLKKAMFGWFLPPF